MTKLDMQQNAHSRYVSINGDIAYELPKGPDESELFYLTGESEDRFSMPALGPAEDVESVGMPPCANRPAFRGRLQGCRRSRYRVFHDLRDLLFKAHS
jgi:hypothetical protein